MSISRLTLLGTVAALGLSFTPLVAEDAKPAPAPAPATETAEETVPNSPLKDDARQGLEDGTWTVEAFGNGCDVSVVKPKGNEQNPLLKIDCLGGRREKAAVRSTQSLALAEKGSIHCAVYCNEKNLPKLAIALATGESYTFQESETIDLKEGWNDVAIDLASKKWKSEASKWKHDAELVGRDDVRAIVLLVYNGRNAAIVYVDGLQADRDQEIEKKVKLLIAKLGAEEGNDRDAAEKDLVKLGRHALGLLEEAAKSTDLEIATRAKRVIKAIGPVAAPVQNAERPQGRVRPNGDPRMAPAVNNRGDQKGKAEAKPEAKVEAKLEAKLEAKPAVGEQNIEDKKDAKAEAKVEAKPEAKVGEQGLDDKKDAKKDDGEKKPEAKPEAKSTE